MHARHRFSRRRGQILLLAAMLMPVLILTGALGVEMGQHSVERSRLQDAVDAAVRAASFNDDYRESALTNIVRNSLAENDIVVGKNGVESVTIQRGKWDDQTRTWELITDASRESECNALRVEVRRSIDSLLAGVVGYNAFEAVADAIVIRPGVVLAVADANNLEANDQAILAYLQSMYVPVRLLGQYELSDDCVMDGEVMFISSTVQQWLVDNSVKDVQAPVLVGESDWFDDFGFAGPGYNTTHGDQYWRTKQCVEVDVSHLAKTGGWRDDWAAWWAANYDNYTNRAYYNSDRVNQVQGKQVQVSNIDARTGWVRRDQLGNDAVVIATLHDNANIATCFLYEKGKRLGNGQVTQHKRAGIFIRTSGNWNSGESFYYTSDGYDILEGCIRWMLSEFEGRPIIVR